MNVDVFEVGEKDEIRISAFNKAIPEFAELKTREELLYVYHSGSYKSPYANYDLNQRANKVHQDYGVEPTEYLRKAVEKFIELQKTPTMRFLKANMEGMEKLRRFLNTVDLNERDEKMKPIYKPYDITSAMEKSGKIIESIQQLEEKVKKELSVATAKVRGGYEVNKWED